MSTPETDSPTDRTRAARAADALDDVRNALGARAQKYARDADLGAMVRELVAEADAAHEIIDGRTTPPTDAEIIAHHAVGGSWLVGGRALHVMQEARAVRAMCERRAQSHAAEAPMWPPYVWVAIDEHGRPCAWPMVQS